MVVPQHTSRIGAQKRDGGRAPRRSRRLRQAGRTHRMPQALVCALLVACLCVGGTGCAFNAPSFLSGVQARFTSMLQTLENAKQELLAGAEGTAQAEADAASADSADQPSEQVASDPSPEGTGIAGSVGIGSAAGGTDADAAADDEASSTYALIKEAIRQAIYEGRTDEVDVSAIGATYDEFEAAWHDLYHEDPRCMHRGGGTNTTVERDGVKYVLRFTVEYIVDDAVLATYQSDLDAAVANVTSQVDPAASEYDKALFVYEWLQNNVTYNNEVAASNESHIARTPLGALAQGTAVCSGYASAYQLVLQSLGISCEFVLSPEEYMDHSWNMVCIDGAWYYADVTWDDGDDEDGAQFFYFLVSEKTLARDHFGWTPAHEAASDLAAPNLIRYSPDDGYTLEDVVREVAASGYTGWVDILSFGVDSETLRSCIQAMSDRGEFGWGTSWQWNDVYDETTGLDRRFTISFW